MTDKKRARSRGGDQGSERRLARKLDETQTSIPAMIFEGRCTQNKFACLVDAFNGMYAVVNEGGKCIVFRRVWDAQLQRHVLERVSFADLRRMYANRVLTLKRGDVSETKTAADWWLADPGRRQYLGGVVFDPTGLAARDRWNLWSGFSVDPEQGDWSLMQQHILEVICSSNREHCDYLVNWLARKFQHPERQGEVAVVLRGKKGCGKGTLGNFLLRAWGQHGIQIVHPKHLVGNFTGHLRDLVFLFADEAFFASDRKAEGALKSYITEPQIFVEAKYQNPIAVPNMLHVLMASNADWIVPASEDERRYFVLDVSPSCIGNAEYFTRLHDQMDGGGLAAMLYDLLKRDISGFRHRAVPRTAALNDQKLHSLDNLRRWWLAVLERGFVLRSRYGVSVFAQWHEFVTTELLFRSFLQWLDETRAYPRMTCEQMGAFMRSMYSPKRPNGSFPVGEVADPLNGNPVVERQRAPGYLVSDLESARRAFASKSGLDLSWDDLEPSG